MKRFLNSIKIWWALHQNKRKVKQRAKAATRVCEMFSLTERNGEVYILCDGLPVCKLSQSLSVQGVISELKNHRKDALNFYQLPEIYPQCSSDAQKCS